MRRPVWIAFGTLVAAGLLGALALWWALEPDQPKKSLVPRGAQLLFSAELPGAAGIPEQKVVTWRIGGQSEDPASGLYGVSVWQGGSELYSRRARAGTMDVRVETRDFTRDGHDDLLVVEDRGGCRVYRTLAIARGSVREVRSRVRC